jgi:hypothetical protein
MEVVAFFMNESFEKMDFGFPSEQVPKLAWKRGVIGNSKERKIAPISWGNAFVAVTFRSRSRSVTHRDPFGKLRAGSKGHGYETTNA